MRPEAGVRKLPEQRIAVRQEEGHAATGENRRNIGTEKEIVKGIIDTEYYLSRTYTAVAIAVRDHLYPYRTEKLSSLSPMVLP